MWIGSDLICCHFWNRKPLNLFVCFPPSDVCNPHWDQWFCPTCWIPIINLHLPVESGGWGVDQTDTPWKMNGRNLQQLPIWKWSSEPNLREGMFHLNLHGCTTVPGESNEFGSIFPSKCPRWASWESTVDLFPPHRNRSGETYTPQKLTWIPKMMVWKRWLLWKNGHVLVSMLHFRGVPPRFWGWCVGLVEYQSVLWFSQKLLWNLDIITCPPS